MKSKKQNLFIKILILWLPPLIWAIIIFTFSARPTQMVSEIHWKDFVLKKLAHVGEYAVFTILLFRAYKESGVGVKKALILSFVSSLIYALTDEFHQSFTPGREPKLRDVFIDEMGASLSVFYLLFLLPRSPIRIKKLAEYFRILY